MSFFQSKIDELCSAADTTRSETAKDAGHATTTRHTKTNTTKQSETNPEDVPKSERIANVKNIVKEIAFANYNLGQMLTTKAEKSKAKAKLILDIKKLNQEIANVSSRVCKLEKEKVYQLKFVHHEDLEAE